MSDPSAVVEWLLAGDPAIRWQTRRDLLDAPESVWRDERSRVETDGWGAALLAAQDDDGRWAGGAFVPRDFDWGEWKTAGQPWTATSFVLTELRELGLDPASPRARRTVELIGANARWDHDGEAFWDGEVEECINGRTVADGAYFGVDVAPIVERLVGEQQADGGWNCERANGSVRSSFASAINVLEGLAEFERATGGTDESRLARAGGEEYLLERALFRRRSTGEVADADFLRFLHPSRWHYDVLRALDHFRAASVVTGAAPDPRLAEAAEHVRSRQRPDGRWDLDWTLPGRAWSDYGEAEGQPSRWVTLKACRALRWWDASRAVA